MGDFEKSAPWDPKGIKGCKRFIEKYWSLKEIVVDGDEIRDDLKKIFNKVIKKVGEDIENLKFNTAISSMMDLVGRIREFGSISKGEMRVLTILLNPFAPHVSSEMWSLMGFSDNIVFVEWPSFDEKFIESGSREIVVQVNGKVRSTFSVSSELSDEELISLARKDQKVIEFINGQTIIKEICVPNKLVNFVVN